MVTWKMRLRITPYFFLLPAMLLLGVFTFYPLTQAVRLSFFEWQIISEPVYTGLQNYRDTFGDFKFWQSILVTLHYVFVSVPGTILLALFTALLLNTKLRLRNLFRSLIFFPAFTSLVAIGMIWRYMYSTDYGILNYLIGLLGGKPVGWLSDPSIALWSLILVTIWHGLGWNMVIFLAGLQNIPEGYYEAARIDGANGIQRFWYITLPLLKPITLFVVVMAVIYTFRSFDFVFVTTRGGPGTSTSLLMWYFYRQGFIMYRMGQATSIALILFLVVLMFTILELRLFRGEVRY
jgi:multiple sugar transport system permease protein